MVVLFPQRRPSITPPHNAPILPFAGGVLAILRILGAVSLTFARGRVRMQKTLEVRFHPGYRGCHADAGEEASAARQNLQSIGGKQ